MEQLNAASQVFRFGVLVHPSSSDPSGTAHSSAGVADSRAFERALPQRVAAGDLDQLQDHAVFVMSLSVVGFGDTGFGTELLQQIDLR